MKADANRTLLRAARRTTFTILILGIVSIILLPMFFLVSLSLMSDREAYNQWPLPLLPAMSARFRMETTAKGFLVSVYNPADGSYVTLAESRDMDYLASFVRRKTNCRLTRKQLAEKANWLNEGATQVHFASPKSLFSNYVTFFTVTHDAIPALFRSLRTAFATIAISLIIGGMGGYAFARYSFKGKALLRMSVLFVRIFPGIAIAIPMVVILGHVGLYDKPMGLALVYSVGQIAITVWITASIFMGIPRDLEEAAQVFGATRLDAFLRVTLPLALPGLAACAMVAFIGAWNETIQALVLTQSNPTFPVVVYQTLVGSKGMVNLVAAGGVAMALPAVIFTVIIRKYILRMWGGVRV